MPNCHSRIEFSARSIVQCIQTLDNVEKTVFQHNYPILYYKVTYRPVTSSSNGIRCIFWELMKIDGEQKK